MSANTEPSASNPFSDVLEANRAYADAFSLRDLPGVAGRGLAVVTCMDSRIDPLAVLGVGPGDVKVVRNAGGQVTDDVLTTLVLSVYLLQVDRIMVLQHTRCKMASATDDEVHALIAEQHGLDTRSLTWGTIGDPDGRLRADVTRITSSPYIPDRVAVGGFRYDVDTGLVARLV